METADIPMTQFSFCVEITNEDSAYHLLRYQGYCSLWIHFTRPNNQANYLQILKRLREAVRRMNFEIGLNDWILHHDNAPTHKALSARQFLAQKSINEIEHPPYYPDLPPNDF
jgi:hypothetical protein